MTVYHKLITHHLHQKKPYDLQRPKPVIQYPHERYPNKPLPPGKTCVWCDGLGNTRDHLVPKWFLQKLPLDQLVKMDRRIVPSCTTCNGRKNGLPPALYAKMRDPDGYARKGNNPDYKRELREWQMVIEYCRSTVFGSWPDDLYAHLVQAMQEPIDLPSLLDLPVPMIKQYGSREVWPFVPEKQAFNWEGAPEPPRFAATMGDIWPKQGT